MQIDIRIAKYLAITYLQISNIHVTEVWKQLIFNFVPLGAVLVRICVIKLSAITTALIYILKISSSRNAFYFYRGPGIKSETKAGQINHSCSSLIALVIPAV